MPATVDPAELRPRVADGVRFAPQSLPRHPQQTTTTDAAETTTYRSSERPHYRVQSSDGRFFDVGYREYVVISQWDGTASLAESVSLAARHLRHDALSMEQATSLLEWTGRSGLIDNVAAETPADAKPLARLNPFWLKIPLAHPDRLLDRCVPLARLLLSRVAIAAMCVVLLAAAVKLPTVWTSIRSTLSGILAPDNWISLLVVWIGLKAIHEAAHAIVAKRYGTRVNQAGLIFILFAPCAYVDVTAAWSLRSRWQRVAIASAGVAVELLVAAVLVLAWSSLATEASRQLAANAIFAATAGSLLFNGNPLMRFDAYFVLSDGLNLPNLGTRSQAVVRSRIARLLFGARPRTKRKEPVFVHAYAWAAAAWRIVITVSLTAAAYTLAPGFGPPLVVVGVVALLAPTIGQAATAWRAAGPARQLRATLIMSGLIAIVAGGLLMPWPGHVAAPGIVDDLPDAIVRTEADGFVEALLVRRGETVVEGQPLLTLRNVDLEADVRQLTAELAQTVLREEAARSRGELSVMQIESRRSVAVRNQLRLAAMQADKLVVTAIRDGVVTAIDWDAKQGQHVRTGDEIARIVDASRRVVASVPNDVVAEFRTLQQRDSNTTSHLLAIGPDGSTAAATLVRLDPRASETPADPFLTAALGGPLPTRAGEPEHTVEPTFPLVATLAADVAWPTRTPVSLQIRTSRNTGTHLWLMLVNGWSDLTTVR